MRNVFIAVMLVFCIASAQAGSQAGAEVIVQEHKLAMEQWKASLENATSVDQVRSVMNAKPDVDKFRDRMIKEIGGSLKRPWAMKYMTWLLENTKLGKKDTDFLFRYAKKYHADSPDLARFCFAVVYSSKSLHEKKAFIDFALKHIKDPKQKGVASLAAAVLLRGLGESPSNIERRMQLLRVAIINSNEVKIGDTSVKEIAQDEIYFISKLSKGRPAPAFQGHDSSMLPVTLDAYKGKVVMLVFWSSFDIDNEQTIALLQLLKRIEKAYLGKPFRIIGVNRDTLANLRELEKQGMVAGKTISDPEGVIYHKYRISSPPMCYVIDQQGKIAYRGLVGSFATLTADALLAPKPPTPAAKKMPMR